MATVLVGVVFAVLLVWGLGHPNGRRRVVREPLNQRQFPVSAIRFCRDVPVPTFFPPLLT